MKMYTQLIVVLLFQLCFLQHSLAQEERVQKRSVQPTSVPTNAIKIRPFSPIFSHLGGSYEFLVDSRNSWELDVGVIGIGGAQSSNTPRQRREATHRGLYLGVSYKHMLNATIFTKKKRQPNSLEGWYFRPQLFLVKYTERSIEQYDRKLSFSKSAVLINIGRQWVLRNVVVIDWYMGFGLGIGSFQNAQQNYYAFMINPHGAGAWTNGLKLGYSF